MKRITYYGILTAAALLLVGILNFTAPGLPLPENDNGNDEAPAGSGLFLLVMLPLEEGDSVKYGNLIDRLDWFKRFPRLPDDIIQGNPPENLEKFHLPAAVYEAREWVPEGAPLTLTFNLEQTTPNYICSDNLAALFEETRDSCYYLWLPLEGYYSDALRASFTLDAGAVLPGLTWLDHITGKNVTATMQDPDDGVYRVVIVKAVPGQQDFNPTIGLYGGEGSWDANVVALKNFFDHYGINWLEFDEKDAVSLDLAEKFDLICFPGGIASEYYSSIPDHENIREFVYGGGYFLGICAGAYYAVDINHWDDLLVNYPLDLFPGIGVWPVSREIGWGQKITIRLDQSHPINSEMNLPSLYLDMLYFDGPYFSPHDEAENVEIIAWYDLNDRPSVVVSYFGKGKALLLGIHPELGYDPSLGIINTGGEEGAQWEWLYAALKWILN